MDETVPLDFWQHAKAKSDGYELLLGRHGKDIYLGIFNWSDVAKEYRLPADVGGMQMLDGRHSKVIKYSGTKNFSDLRKELSYSNLK
jgi:hypothetical protein